MSHLYEGKIKNMGNAGRNGGEYDTLYDAAVGSAGFLCEAFDYLSNSDNASIALQKTSKASANSWTRPLR